MVLKQFWQVNKQMVNYIWPNWICSWKLYNSKKFKTKYFNKKCNFHFVGFLMEMYNVYNVCK